MDSAPLMKPMGMTGRIHYLRHYNHPSLTYAAHKEKVCRDCKAKLLSPRVQMHDGYSGPDTVMNQFCKSTVRSVPVSRTRSKERP